MTISGFLVTLIQPPILIGLFAAAYWAAFRLPTAPKPSGPRIGLSKSGTWMLRSTATAAGERSKSSLRSKRWQVSPGEARLALCL